MSVPVAYIAVILIWSTTPLGIVWSSESVSPTLAVFMRMLVALLVCLLIVKLMKVEFPWHKKACRLYSYSGLGIYSGMLLGYMSAKYITSGMMSLVFGFAPIISGFMAQKILGEAKLSRVKLLALTISLCGLAIICSDSLSINEKSWIGILFVLIAVFFFSLSAILVKSVKISIHPIASTTGSLSISTPLFFLSWLLLDGTLPIEEWSERALWSILYLAIFGSLIGFVAYYYVLQRLATSTVALITLITPVFALSLGVYLNQEAVSSTLIFGTAFITAGLTIYQFGERWLFMRVLVRES